MGAGELVAGGPGVDGLVAGGLGLVGLVTGGAGAGGLGRGCESGFGLREVMRNGNWAADGRRFTPMAGSHAGPRREQAD